jgi:hypothetical protein
MSAKARPLRLGGSTRPMFLSTLDLLVANTTVSVRPQPTWLAMDAVREPPKGNSSTGRASVSKTEGWGFKSLLPCWEVGYASSGR